MTDFRFQMADYKTDIRTSRMSLPETAGFPHLPRECFKNGIFSGQYAAKSKRFTDFFTHVAGVIGGLMRTGPTHIPLLHPIIIYYSYYIYFLHKRHPQPAWNDKAEANEKRFS